MYGKTETCGNQGRRQRALDHSFFNDTLILSLRSTCCNSCFILNKAKPFLPRGAAARNWESANSSPPWPVLHRCIHKQSKQRSIYQLFRVNCFWEMSPFFNELFCAVKITVSTECSSPKYSFQIKIKHILMFLVIAKCFQWSKLFDLWLWCRSTWSCWNQKRVEACCKQVSLMKNVSNLLLTAK